MSEVKRYQADWHEMFLDLPGRRMGTEERLVVLASDFDRVTAERDAALAELSEIKESLVYRGSLLCRIEGQRDDLQQKLTVATAMHPFAEKVIRKLERFQGCVDDGQGADIGRHWFDLLTQLGLLNRVQRSPALWEMTQQGEDALELSWQSAKSR
ncbi:hypothetical protein PflCFBP13510_12240 [Pseudomonas fluorescens]|nr:hypothetical protein PflCFBP13510_12240 [Pseudomonas fluorescens]